MTANAFPSHIRRSIYGPDPKKRAADLPGVQAMRLRDLFPDIPRSMYTEGDDLSVIRESTQGALKNVNMDVIKPDDTVNILSSQYGFQIMDGQAYKEMIKTIRDIVKERTGCENIRLRVATGFRLREPNEIIDHYGLKAEFNGHAE
jgi:hypothetical protein